MATKNVKIRGASHLQPGQVVNLAVAEVVKKVTPFQVKQADGTIATVSEIRLTRLGKDEEHQVEVRDGWDRIEAAIARGDVILVSDDTPAATEGGE